jgi:hypothetical protein
VDDQRRGVAVGRLGELEHAGLPAQRPGDDLVDVAQDRGALAGGQARVGGYDGRAEQQAAVQRLDERQAVLQREPDGLAAPDPADVERPGRADGAQQQLAVRDRLVGRLDGDPVGG